MLGRSAVLGSRQKLTAGAMTLAPSVQPLHLTPRGLRVPQCQRWHTTTMASESVPTLPPMESSETFNPEFNSASDPLKDGALTSPTDEPAPNSPDQRAAPQDAHTQQRVHDILHSDVGVATLLNRLKASIASARVSRRLLELCCTPRLHTW